MYRPKFITLCGWLMLLVGAGGFIAMCLSPHYRSHLATKWPTFYPEANLAAFVFIFAAAFLGGKALLQGRPRSRVYFTLLVVIGGTFSLLTIQEPVLVNGRSTTDPRLILGAGVIVAVFCSLYSPYANQFFNPEAPAIPFRIYNAARQVVLMAALVLISLGTVRYITVGVATRKPITISSDVAQGRLRTFKTVNGLRIQARLVSIDGTRVTLERADGHRFVNSLGDYSEQDQVFIKEAAAAGKPR